MNATYKTITYINFVKTYFSRQKLVLSKNVVRLSVKPNKNNLKVGLKINISH